MARRPDSTLAWLGAGLVVTTFPFVARATFDEYDGGGASPSEDAVPLDGSPSAPTEDAPIVDGGPVADATPPNADASTTTFGGDAGGISCAFGERGATTSSAAVMLAVGAWGLVLRRRRRGPTA